MRARHWLTIAASLLLIVTFSGCAGAKAKTPAAVADPIYVQPIGFDENTGSIQGTVVDDELRPLEDAIVGFIDPYQATKTDEAGHFEIGLLQAGQRNLYVIHLGHQSDGKRITIKVGEATNVVFTLPVLPIEEPWIDVVEHRGRFDQAVKIDPMGSSLNATSYQWRLRDQPKALEAVHLDAEWRDNNNLAGGLRLTLGLGGSATKYTFFTVDGKSPLRGDANRQLLEETWTKPKTVCVKDPCLLTWSATPTTHTTNLPVDIGVMIDQPFEVLVSHFFRQEMPAGYTLTP